MKRRMKRITLLLVIFICLGIMSIKVSAEGTKGEHELISEGNKLTEFVDEQLDSIWSELEDKIPDEAKDMMEENEIESLSSMMTLTPSQLMESIKHTVSSRIEKPMAAIGQLICTLLLCAVINAVRQSGVSKQLKDIFNLTAAACAISFLSGPVLDCITETVDKLSECSLFVMSFTPVMSGVMLAGGHPATAGAYNMILFFTAEILSELAAQTLIPILCIYLALCIIAPLAPFLNIDSIASALKSVVCWGLGILTTIFVGMLSLQTVIGSGGDSLMLKTSKFLIGSFIPVIGSTISDALGAAKGCVQLIKGVVGSFGIVVAAFTFLPTLVKVTLWYIAISVSSWLGRMLGVSEIAKLLSSIAQTFSILIAMVVCFMLLILVSTAMTLMLTVG